MEAAAPADAEAAGTPLTSWLSEQSLPASIAEAAAQAGISSVEQLAAMSNPEVDGLATGAGLKKVVVMRLKHRLDSHRFAARTAARKQAAGQAEITARALVADGNTLAAARAMVLSPTTRSSDAQPEAEATHSPQVEQLQPMERPVSPPPQAQIPRSPREPSATNRGAVVSVSSFSSAHPRGQPEPEPEPEPEWRLEPATTPQPGTGSLPEAVPPPTTPGTAAQQTYDGLRDRIQHLERAAPVSFASVGVEIVPDPVKGVGSAADLEGEAAVLCDEMGLLRQRATKAGEPLATQATRLEPRLRSFASRALQLHSHASALQTESEGKARRLQSAHDEKLEMEQAHREHRMHSESLEQLAEQKHAAEIRAMQVQVEEAKAALAEEASARAKEWAEASAMQEELEAKLAQRTEQLRRLQREFDMAGEQLDREFETQSSRLNATETDLAETETALAELGEENAGLREQLLQGQEQLMAVENDHRSTVEAMQRQMKSQAEALEHLRTEDSRVDAVEGSMTQLQGLNDQLLEALIEVRAENTALSGEALTQQMEEMQKMNSELNEALAAKNTQVAEVQKENARLEALNAKLVHVHAAPEQVEQAVETRQLLKDHDELRANYTAMLQERESHTAEYKALHDQFATLQAEKALMEEHANELAEIAETFMQEGATNTAAAQHPAAHLMSSSVPYQQPASLLQQQQQPPPLEAAAQQQRRRMSWQQQPAATASRTDSQSSLRLTPTISSHSQQPLQHTQSQPWAAQQQQQQQWSN